MRVVSTVEPDVEVSGYVNRFTIDDKTVQDRGKFIVEQYGS